MFATNNMDNKIPVEINSLSYMVTMSDFEVSHQAPGNTISSSAHWLKCVASVLSDVPLLVATLWAESWALIRVLRSAWLRHVWTWSIIIIIRNNDYTCIAQSW